MKTHYNKSQNGILGIISICILVIVNFIYFYVSDSKAFPFTLYLVLTLVFLVSLVLFYKLTITIDNEKISATFGIGLLKRSIKIKDIASIEEYKIPWYIGIGIRLSPKGWLWNVKTGKAILIKNKEKTKIFLVGTVDYDKISNILKQLKA